MAYFERLGEHRFRATEHTGGAWDGETQHIAPALGLLAHEVERDRDVRRSDGLVITRLSYDILGTVPIAEVETGVEVVRGGRTIELVEAVLAYAGRPVVRLRAWLMQQRDTSAIAGTGLTRLPPPTSWSRGIPRRSGTAGSSRPRRYADARWSPAGPGSGSGRANRCSPTST